MRFMYYSKRTPLHNFGVKRYPRFSLIVFVLKLNVSQRTIAIDAKFDAAKYSCDYSFA